ncbi:MAG: hypothetical protein RL660_1275 [Bacteroidota bacterium]|jgi:hypothetical protein
MSNTQTQYQQVVASCFSIYNKKVQDYGTSWRVLRPISLVDQIYIKAMRIRQLQSSGVNKVGDSKRGEWQAIVNYGIIACIQLELNNYESEWDLDANMASSLYQQHSDTIYNLMQAKNHDYGEAWRNMSEESFVDLIITKLLRIRQIIANDGKTQISEGMDANFHDIVNYAVFALILY